MSAAAAPSLDRTLYSVLVVDDNASSRYATARALRAGGFNIMEAAAGAEALELVDYVAAVVLDVHLPDLLGFEVCRLLRARAATALLPVVYVSALYVTPGDQIKGMQTGADAYMVAPVDPETLLATLDHLIADRAGPRH